MHDEQTIARKAYRPALSSQSKMVTRLNRTEKNEDKEQDKTTWNAPQ